MADGMAAESGGAIGDAAEGGALDAEAGGGFDLAGGGHADGVGAPGAEGANLRRRLVTRAGHLAVDAGEERDAASVGDLSKALEQTRRIRAGAWAGGRAGAGEPPGP